MRIKKQELRIKNNGLNKVLEEIVRRKKEDLVKQKKEISLSKLKEFASNLSGGQNAFKQKIIDSKGIALIAEIKLVSPSDTSFKPVVEIMDQAHEYEKVGADAISYITEKYFFKGDVSKVVTISAKVGLPILQKDFVIDEYQIYESKIVGSSALLLIARLVDVKKLKNFVEFCLAEGIEPVVEINNDEDLRKAIKTTTNIIAVNARDLSTFEVDVDKARELMKKVPDKYIKLGFSGIKSVAEVKKYKDAGARGVLVGTSLMKSKNIAAFIKELKI